jgi:hypothetical protein
MKLSESEILGLKEVVAEITDAESKLQELHEEHLLIGKAKMKQVFDVVKPALKFDCIFKNASMFGTPLERHEYWLKSGEPLKGLLISSLVECSKRTDTEQTEDCTECFLMDDGSLKVFYTTHKWVVSKNSIHHTVSRIEIEVDEKKLHFDFVIKAMYQAVSNRRLMLEDESYFLNQKLTELNSIDTELACC